MHFPETKLGNKTQLSFVHNVKSGRILFNLSWIIPRTETFTFILRYDNIIINMVQEQDILNL